MENNSTAQNSPKPMFSRGLSRLPAWLKNKYFISLAFFIGIIFFLDKNDLLTQYDRRSHLKDLEQSKRYYSGQITAERKDLEALKTNPAVLEKYAREKYLMKKDNEELFLISEKPVNAKN